MELGSQKLSQKLDVISLININKSNQKSIISLEKNTILVDVDE
jgi:hypothetical protein